MKKLSAVILSINLFAMSNSYAEPISVPNIFTAGEAAVAAEVNENFQTLVEESNRQNSVIENLQAMMNAITPTGSVVAFAGTTIPEGWALCDGSEVSREEHAALFAVLGTAHGEGDGVDTFNLPDYRGLFLRGVDAGRGLDADAEARTAPQTGANTGDAVGSFQGIATASPNAAFNTSNPGQHNHTTKICNNSQSGTALRGANGGLNCAFYNNDALQSAGNHTHQVLGGDTETRPVNAAVNWIIRY